MPIQKFRNLDDARQALWVRPGQPDLVSRIKSLWAFSSRLVLRRIPRGVRKFRSIEEANRDRDRWIERRIQALRSRRTPL